MDAKKAIILVVNKWDLEKHTEADTNELIKKLRLDFKFLDYAPILFMSAKTGKGVEKLLPSIEKAYEGFNRRIPTPILNRIIADAQAVNPTPSFNHGRLKIVFANQVTICPPTFVFFCNNPNYAHFSYTRYLENRLRESFDFTGTPLNIIYRLRK
jgi:GTP-binding protein